MIKDCIKCKNNCCGKIKDIRPVLLPYEEKRLRKYSEIITTPHRKMFALKRRNGHCIFFDKSSGKCRIYAGRPLECRIYPFLLDFSKRSVDVYLDKRHCKLKASKTAIQADMEAIRKIHLSIKWINAYNSMENF